MRRGALGWSGVGNESEKLSTRDMELRTKYWELCTLYGVAVRESRGPHRQREAPCYCWLPRVGAMLGPPFAGIAVEGIGYTGAWIR